MKKIIIILLILIPPVKLLKAQNVFDNNFNDIEGNNVILGDLKGEKLTVLDFWATWCKPCVNSIPKLVNLSDQLKNKGVNLIGINEDSPRNTAKVQPFAFSLGITYPVLLDPNQRLLSDMMIDALPTLIILDKNGKVIYTHQGFSNGDENVIKNKISSLLEEMD
jgi:thiol-disulfide isomerase/thioredoxin